MRGWRDSVGVAPSAVIPARLNGLGPTREHVARLARLAWDEGDAEPVARVAGIELLPSDDVDLEAHERRSAERRKTLEAEIKRAEGKLANEKFVAKAPEAVVQAERDKLAGLREELGAL